MPIYNREIKEVRYADAHEEPYALQRDFWKLGNSYEMDEEDIKDELDDLNAFYVHTDSKEQLMTRLHRAQAGQLSYGRYDVPTLLGFAKERGLIINSDDHAGIIEELEYADDHQSFARLFDLPAELRKEIYHYACEPNGGELRQPVEPPICLASKVLRTEALPVLYRNLTLNLSVHVDFELESVILTDAAVHMINRLQSPQFMNLKAFMIMNYSDDETEYDPHTTGGDVCWSLTHHLKARDLRDWWTVMSGGMVRRREDRRWLETWMTRFQASIGISRYTDELTLERLKEILE